MMKFRKHILKVGKHSALLPDKLVLMKIWDAKVLLFYDVSFLGDQFIEIIFAIFIQS